ncbi:MAG: FAD-binding oxidoreductase [Burkholderiales bacterium]|nr:FAD-binding oxidoreductase [Burkholderiales bacterium]
MPAFTAALHAALPDLLTLGADRPDHAREPHEQDWRKRYRGRALAIVFPTDTTQVQALVKLCELWQVPVVAQGGNTSLVGGSVPDASGLQLVINLCKMNQILAVDADNQSITVQAGCTLQQVQDAALNAGLIFPLSLASEGSCTIGGNLATNAGGTQVLRYGTMRELCLGLEAVTAQGERYAGLQSLRKDNTGYAIKDLLIGSEGTLGIVTAATLRLYPRPASQQAALITCPSLQAAVALLRMARQSLDAGLTGFEVIHRDAFLLARQHTPLQSHAADSVMPQDAESIPPWLVLLDAGSPQAADELQESLESLINQAVTQGHALDACLSMSHAQYRAMWQLRETIPMAEKIEGMMVKHDIGVPTSAVPAFVAQSQTALQAAFPGCRVICFGHLGDGNLHYNVQGPLGQPDSEFLQRHEHQVNTIVYDLVAQLNGTLSAEHGIGQLKKDELAERADPVRLQLMRLIKQTLDPEGLLNPGRLVDGARETSSSN